MINRTMSWRFRKSLDEVKELIMTDLASSGNCDTNSLRAYAMGKTTGFYIANTENHRNDPRYRNLRLKLYQPNEEVTYVYLDLNGLNENSRPSYYPTNAILIDMRKPVGEKFGTIEVSDESNDVVETNLMNEYNIAKDIISDIHFDSMYA